MTEDLLTEICLVAGHRAITAITVAGIPRRSLPVNTRLAPSPDSAFVPASFSRAVELTELLSLTTALTELPGLLTNDHPHHDPPF